MEDWEREYRAKMNDLMEDFKRNKDNYFVPQDITRHMTPGVAEFEEKNREVMREAIAHLKFGKVAFWSALEKRRKELEKQQKEQQSEEERQTHRASVNETFGGLPQDAREAVWMYINANGVSVAYDGTCYLQGTEKAASSLEAAILLSCEAFGFTLGDTKVMTNAGIKLAFAEFLEVAREDRKDVVWARIESTDHASAAKALMQLRDLCERLFIEPAFADAAIRKFIWQTKRKLAGLYIRDHHMLVLRGPQGSGKTELCRNIIIPIGELGCEASLAQIVDDRNFAIRRMYVAFPDELARGDRTDLNLLKGVITGESSTSRVLYSHHSQKNPVNLTLIGTADKPMTSLISDLAGMRRFVEVVMKPREQVDGLDWQRDVVDLDWESIWAAVDHTTEDPIMSVFGDLLREKQDGMRRRSNVEAWLEAFEFNPTQPTPPRRDHVADLFVEYGAQDLYKFGFRVYEQTFHPGATPTSLTSWGLAMKDMIDGDRLPAWSYRKLGQNTLYRYELSNVMPMRRPSPAKDMAVVVASGKSQGIREEE